jgi:hypothetical protein
MNKFNVVSLIALSLVVSSGCAHPNPPVAPTDNQDDPSPAMGTPRPSRQCPSCSNDGFDTAGQVVSVSSRWVWIESQKAWVYLNSPEFAQHIQNAKDDAASAADLVERQVKALNETYSEWKIDQQKKDAAAAKK